MVSVFTPFYKAATEEALVALAMPRYENDQLISLIGSKRPILGQLRMILSPLVNRSKATRFLDPFCGSGAVSRLARSMGMQVLACDLEPFSYILNHVYLTLSSDDLVPMFGEMGGIDAYLSMLNLHCLYAAETGSGITYPYLSRFYAPANEGDADGRRERLFFTPANARFLDAVREEIEESWINRKLSASEKAVILATILHEASRRANVSGSYTSYLKNLDACRARIREACLLKAPTLADPQLPAGEMHLSEASRFVASRSADICYLDPPASVHQYGSAYHLLNSITVWDRYAPSEKRDANGHLIDRAGIRADWKQTHSRFCSLKDADAAFVHLINSIDARHIVLTYPSTGCVSAQRIVELLRARHEPVMVIPLHKRNQGGRQGKDGKRNIEQVFVTGKQAGLSLTVGESLERLPLIERLDSLVSAVFSEPMEGEPLRFIGQVVLDTPLPTEALLALPCLDLERLVRSLEQAACVDAQEAMRSMARAIKAPSTSSTDRIRLEKRALSMCKSLEREGNVEVLARMPAILREEGVHGKVLDVIALLAYDEKKE